MFSYKFLSVFCVICVYVSFCSQQDIKRPTLVISLDAFRYDYIFRIRELAEKNGEESNFWTLIRSGAFAGKGIGTTFTTLTLPIHYGIATGLYEESHGVVGNIVYDPVLNESVNLQHPPNANHSWVYGGEPIWKTLQKQATPQNKDDAVGCIMWIGCEVAGLKRWLPFHGNASLEILVTQAIEWLETGTQLVLIYHDLADAVGHKFGPDSEEMNDTLLRLDKGVGYLLRHLKEKKLFNEINLILMSDHGIIQVNDSVQIDAPADMFYVRSRAQPIWLVEPMPGRYRDTIKYFEQFSHIRVIEKQNVPDRWHYKNSDRISPLIVLAQPGYLINKPGVNGTHGYDNALWEMRPLFIGHGPAFIPQSSVPENMSIVDVYLLLCRLLGLKPALNNGTEKYFGSFVKLVYLLNDLPKSTFEIDDQPQTGAQEDVRHHTPLIVMAVSISITLLVLLVLLLYACIPVTPKQILFDKIRKSTRSKEGDRLLGAKSPIEAESENEEDAKKSLAI